MFRIVDLKVLAGQTVPLAMIVSGDDGMIVPKLAFGGKYVLHRTTNSVLSAGLRVETPTDEDLEYDAVVLETQAWYLTPYVGYLHSCNDWYFQAFISHRMRTGNQSLFLGGAPRPDRRDPNVISADASVGYWLYRNDCQRGLTALVPTLEIHYQSQTEGDASRSFSDLVYGRYMTNLSLTAGITAIFGERLTASAALVTPLRSNIDIPAFGPLSGLNTDTARNYDAQLAVQVNYFYGAK